MRRKEEILTARYANDANLPTLFLSRCERSANPPLPTKTLFVSEHLDALTGDTDYLRHLSPRVAPHVQVSVRQRVGVVETREAGNGHDQFVLHVGSSRSWRTKQLAAPRNNNNSELPNKQKQKLPLPVQVSTTAIGFSPSASRVTC